ncbi:MAG TPA: SPW repeat protein [candidate division Zixibacteria bacterium]|nr:SPW repeat protein [candidate division Zixibacteria bacterium]
MRNLYWFAFHLIVGVWLIVSPYVLAFTDVFQAYWNAVAAGAVFVLSSAIALYLDREHIAEEWSHAQRKAA